MKRSLVAVGVLLTVSLGVAALPELAPQEARILKLEARVAVLEQEVAELKRMNTQLQAALAQPGVALPPGAQPFEYEGKTFLILPAQPR